MLYTIEAALRVTGLGCAAFKDWWFLMLGRPLQQFLGGGGLQDSEDVVLCHFLFWEFSKLCQKKSLRMDLALIMIGVLALEIVPRVAGPGVEAESFYSVLVVRGFRLFRRGGAGNTWVFKDWGMGAFLEGGRNSSRLCYVGACDSL